VGAGEEAGRVFLPIRQETQGRGEFRMRLDRRPALKIAVVFSALCAFVVSPGLALIPVAGSSAADVATGASGKRPVLFSALPAA